MERGAEGDLEEDGGVKIHGICLIKNEGDIIEFTLLRALAWCDHIYVFDNGSADGTWEKVQALARSHPAIVPFQSSAEPFSEGLRSRVFNRFQSLAAPGDWWCRLDADEIYIDDPRRFLAAVPAAYHVVWAIQFQYYLVREELDRFVDLDACPPIESEEQLPRHYRADASEARFFRHRQGLLWPPGAWPRHMGLTLPRRIRLRHYKYRSPGQLKMRLAVRKEAAPLVWPTFADALEYTWKEKIGQASQFHFDDGTGNYILDEQRLPKHLESILFRVLKRILHGVGIWP